MFLFLMHLLRFFCTLPSFPNEAHTHFFSFFLILQKLNIKIRPLKEKTLDEKNHFDFLAKKYEFLGFFS